MPGRVATLWRYDVQISDVFLFAIILQQFVNGIDPRNHRQHSRVHACEIGPPSGPEIVVRHIGDERAIREDVRDRLWKVRMQNRGDQREDEMDEPGDARPAKYEPTQKARKPHSLK